MEDNFMNSILIIAEKPSVGVSLSKVVGANNRNDGYYEGNGYVVSWCVGHIVGLAEPEEYGGKYAEKPWKVENLPIIPDDWKLTVNKDKRKQFEVLKKLMNRADITEIVCATDAAREGELIFRYVYNKTGCKKPFKRLWISSLEESAIKDGMENLRPGSDYDNLYASGYCRDRADFLLGMNLTRLYSAVYRTFLSVGRVQTPTLAMIVERDYKVNNFVKEKYFMVNLEFNNTTASSERIDDLAEAEKIKSACDNKTVTVKEIKREKKTVNPPKIFDLTSMQREANRLYGFTAQETLESAQRLYESRLITYPRTDSQYLTEDMAGTVQGVIEVLLEKLPKYKGAEYTPNVERVINSALVGDHHGIIPTAEVADANLSNLTEEEWCVLMLIINKLFCATADKYEYEAVTAVIDCNGFSFTSKSKTILKDGWKAIERFIKSSEHEDIPTFDPNYKVPAILAELGIKAETSFALDEGQTFENPACNIEEKWTSPPAHFTEDTLLKQMEIAGQRDVASASDFVGEELVKCGLGTPATRAGIIETLIKRKYIVRRNKKLIATEKGINLIDVVPDSVKSAKLTAEWETELHKIAKGEANADDFMGKIEDFTRKIVAENSAAEPAVAFRTPSDTEKIIFIGCCPKCGDGDVAENSKAYSCFLRCGFVIWKSTASKTITPAQAKQLLEKGRTDKIKGFKNKAGKSFDAALVLSKDYKVEFDFK
jgi:DNA topoisomerase-3